jgi:hypothetical protein
MFVQRVGCFRAVSNPNENIGASSGSTFLKARVVLTVQGAANECRRLGIGRVRKETEEAKSDEAETFSSIIKVSSLSERIEDSEAIPEYPGAFEGLRRRLRCHRQLRRDEVLADRGDFSEAICISHRWRSSFRKETRIAPNAAYPERKHLYCKAVG